MRQKACRACKYSLIAVPSGDGAIVCPECGLRQSLIAEPVSAPWWMCGLAAVVCQIPMIVCFMHMKSMDDGWGQMGTLIIFSPACFIISSLLSMGAGAAVRSLGGFDAAARRTLIVSAVLSGLLEAGIIAESVFHSKGGC